ncbi:MAG: MoxR family ATPase [Flavobacteriales bacterium]|nr:MoxR family ATPase [Flavobacteriales bacterium]MCB9448996.1 MoxR family ATPase [Flavobacteriales bacterium]
MEENTTPNNPAPAHPNQEADGVAPQPTTTQTDAPHTVSAGNGNHFVGTVFQRVKEQIQHIVIGNDPLIELIMTGMFSGGHILIEGVPGVAKTLTAKLIAKCMQINFTRIQFTPDLMPSDIIGTNIFHMQRSEFEFRKGPLFSNLVLVDEINRAPAKTQSALFEVMEERQITLDGVTRVLPLPFFVIATQNPVEHEGIYKLPEAQLDRFLFKLIVGYPNLEEESKILKRFREDFNMQILEDIKAVASSDDILKCMKLVESVHIKDDLLDYIAKIVYETRNNSDLYLGGSPRASLAIMKTSKAIAAIRGRDFVTPDDIQTVCHPVLNHRIIMAPEKEIEGVTTMDVISDIIRNIEVPR